MTMDFRFVPSEFHPAYTWLWNTTVTREEIKRQIDEMYESGIRAFYVLGEPKEFRPTRRRTFLQPEYLSEDYLDLVHYASSYAKEKGMYTWLYNEGGFPSGMVCGKIRQLDPSLTIKQLTTKNCILPANTPYHHQDGCIASFAHGKRIAEDTVFPEDTEITQYINAPIDCLRADIADKRTTELFLKLTHEAYKAKFGDSFGNDVTMMFDDEASMGSWTDGLETLFKNRYGYEIEDFLPVIAGSEEPATEEQYRAKSDYAMLCGELVTENYFNTMRKWLNDNNMLSVGHLNLDNQSDAPSIMKYGNMLSMLRAFDVPGVDVIWSQITYPTDGKCCFEGNQFFPRLASSAAHQQGHSKCLSESFAVYGAQVTPEEMRFVVNYQAVRGISLFNFMVISYGRNQVLCFQYRPSFIPENPGMDSLKQINDYTARLSYLLQTGRPEVSTALYYPQRTICAGGDAQKTALDSYDAMGLMLEQEGVSFDLLDEDLVMQGTVIDGKLVTEHVVYEQVFVPEAAYELPEVTEKLRKLNRNIVPCVKRNCQAITARKLSYADDCEGYFICSCHGETIHDTISIETCKYAYEIDLYTGDLYKLPCNRKDGQITFSVQLHRGEGIFVFLSPEPMEAEVRPEYRNLIQLDTFSSFVSRRFTLDPEKGPINTYYTDGDRQTGLSSWPADFSGEYTYLTTLPPLPNRELLLDLGKVNSFAQVYLNDKKIGEATMPPFTVPLAGAKEGDELKIVVANTIANVCHDADYLNNQPPADIGTYHVNMVKQEKRSPVGGLLGPVWIAEKQ